VHAASDWLSFQEYFVERNHRDPVDDISFRGAGEAAAAPGVIDAIENADTVVIAPSNPPLSIWPIVAIEEISNAVRAHPKRTAVSPLFGGVPLKGPADAVMHGLGLPSGTSGILEAYTGLIDTLFIDVADAADASLGDACGVRVLTADTRLGGPDHGARFASTLLGAGG
jgi:LPPG:FO 2-phospho-L-lactate transferase